MGAVDRTRSSLAALSLGVLAIHATANDAQIEAVWKPQRATFTFIGETTHYSCAALEHRLRSVLVLLGAHEQMHVDRRECSPYAEMRLHITFMSPIEATPENVRALTTFDTKEQLIAQLRDIDPPAAEDLLRFPAEWQTISFARDRRLRLSASDCELMEQIRRQLLPRLATRDVPKRLHCGVSMRPPPLKVSALVARAQ